MNFTDLIGKTIDTATLMKKTEYDDEAWLKLTFSDGTSCVLGAEYVEDHIGKSEGEYPAYIYITNEIDDELIPVSV